MADVVAARDGCQRLARGAPPQGFAPLMEGQLRLAPEPHPLGLRALPSVAGASADQFALELRQPRMVSISRPWGLVVSAQASARERKPAPLSVMVLRV